MTPNEQNKMDITSTEGDRPSREDAEAAVRTLIKWTGDNPDREGLVDTPARVVRSYDEFFAGYHEDAEEMLNRTFEEVDGYDDMVLLRNIRVESYCEHHIVPILGSASIAYFPDRRVVGISKLARVIDIFAKRLQTQETMTSQIANTIQTVLQPKGVALIVDAAHQCMTTRGVRKPGVSMVTTRFTGCFENDPALQNRILMQTR
ncbi:MAG: GTP cyclohydrolase I FolE [Alphaproteobacteria bacterium]|nr:GTP cyclohydrolase I FolE [Alphaproteobacteria bacterium]